jgi:N utilization substance protein B
VAGPRSRARQLALQYLYCIDVRGGRPAVACAFDDFARELKAAPRSVEYAGAIAAGVARERPRIDGLITAAAENWEMARMSAVERNILRMGVFELMPGSGVPQATAIDEAIKLAKAFGDKASGSFVNGVLDAVRKKLAENLES